MSNRKVSERYQLHCTEIHYKYFEHQKQKRKINFPLTEAFIPSITTSSFSIVVAEKPIHMYM